MDLNVTGASVIFFITLLAGITAYMLATQMKDWIKYLLSFSGAYLFGLTITHLLPEMYEHSGSQTWLPVCILIGFFVQLILEQFSRGVEHGHIHVHENERFPVMLLVSLLIHAIMEGALLSDHAHGGHEDGFGLNYLFGLSIHKIPIAVVLAILLRKSKISRIGAIIVLVMFALATPVGTIASGYLTIEIGSVLMALVAGSFLHISTTILFESTPNHKFNLLKFMLALVGAATSFLI